MGEPRTWGLSRFMALLAVLALHVAVLGFLITTSRNDDLSASTQSLELMFLSPARVPGLRVASALPQSLGADSAISAKSPLLTVPALPPVAAADDGAAQGVDWAAEAHRAAEAAARNDAGSAGGTAKPAAPSAGSDWWQRPQHHGGDQFKTDTGDWIVWTSSKCFQIASSLLRVLALGAALPMTQCPGESHSPRGDLFDQLPAYRNLHPQL